jgi:hypothetical protein
MAVMAKTGAPGVAEARESEEGERGRALSESGGAGLVQKREGPAGTRGIVVGALLMHGRHAVVGSDMGKVGHRFGLDPGRIGQWTKNEVCNPHEGLQIQFNVHFN